MVAGYNLHTDIISHDITNLRIAIRRDKQGCVWAPALARPLAVPTRTLGSARTDWAAGVVLDAAPGRSSSSTVDALHTPPCSALDSSDTSTAFARRCWSPRGRWQLSGEEARSCNGQHRPDRREPFLKDNNNKNITIWPCRDELDLILYMSVRSRAARGNDCGAS